MLRNQRWGVATVVFSLFVASCAPTIQPFDLNVANVDESGAQGPATILFGAPEVFARETLINDRRREDTFVQAQLTRAATVEFEPDLRRDLASITTLSAELRAGFNPTAGAIAQRDQDLAETRRSVERGLLETRGEIAKVELELKLENLRRELAKLEADPKAKADTSGQDGKLGEGTVKDATTELDTAVPFGDAAEGNTILTSLKNQLTTASQIVGELGKLRPDAVPEAKSKLSPEEEYRRRRDLRAEIRADLASLNLDDVHDVEGNALYRLQFNATVLPNGIEKDRWGFARASIVPWSPSGREIQALYFAWLTHVTSRLNRIRPDLAEADSGIFPDPTFDRLGRFTDFYSVASIELAEKKLIRVAVPNDAQRAFLETGFKESTTELRCLSKGIANILRGEPDNDLAMVETLLRKMLDVELTGRKEKPKSFCPGAGNGEASRSDIPNTRNKDAEQTDTADTDAAQTTATQADAEQTDAAQPDVVQTNAAEAGATHTGAAQPDAPQPGSEGVGAAGNLANVDAFLEIAPVIALAVQALFDLDLPTEFRGAALTRLDLFDQVIGAIQLLKIRQDQDFDLTQALQVPDSFRAAVQGDHRTFAFKVTPSGDAQSISTLASASNALQLALGLAATIPTQGIKVGGGVNFLQAATGSLDALERVPRVVGNVGRKREWPERATFGWVFGPEVRIDTDRKQLILRQTPLSRVLTADISVPGWWPWMQLMVETTWVGAFDTLRFVEGSLLDTQVAELGSNFGNSAEAPPSAGVHAQTFRVNLPLSRADLDSLTTMLARQAGAFPIRTARISRYAPQSISRCSGSRIFLIEGPDLWREPKVFLSGRESGRVEVLPDMGGISAFLPVRHLNGVEEAELTVWTRSGVARARVNVDCKTASDDGSDVAFDLRTTRLVKGDSKQSTVELQIEKGFPGGFAKMQIELVPVIAGGGRIRALDADVQPPTSGNDAIVSKKINIATEITPPFIDNSIIEAALVVLPNEQARKVRNTDPSQQLVYYDSPKSGSASIPVAPTTVGDALRIKMPEHVEIAYPGVTGSDLRLEISVDKKSITWSRVVAPPRGRFIVVPNFGPPSGSSARTKFDALPKGNVTLKLALASGKGDVPPIPNFVFKKP